MNRDAQSEGTMFSETGVDERKVWMIQLFTGKDHNCRHSQLMYIDHCSNNFLVEKIQMLGTIRCSLKLEGEVGSKL